MLFMSFITAAIKGWNKIQNWCTSMLKIQIHATLTHQSDRIVTNTIH